MPLPAEPRFALPEPPRAPRWAWAVAVALQAGLTLLLISEPQLDRPPDAFRLLLPTEIPVPSSSPVMRYQRAPSTRRAEARVAAKGSPRSVEPGAPRVVRSEGPGAPALTGGIAVLANPDSAGDPGSASPFRQHFGSGTLWVRPMPMTPQEIATQLGGQSRQQITDSVLTAIIQGYLDRMAEERAHQGPPLPSWVTTIGGKKVGVDQKWIYLGPIRIPAALLALLPINSGGNPTAAEYNKRLSAMREDLFEAARRSANYDEFTKAVKGLREETQRKRDFEKNRRTAPDSGHNE